MFRNWSWWLLFPLMGVLTLGAYPLNDLAAEMFGNYDPQGADQVLEQLGVLAAHRYTSGHSVGQLLALLLGVALGAGSRGGTSLSAKLTLAVLTAIALAAVAGAVTYALSSQDPIVTGGLEAEVLADSSNRFGLPPDQIRAGVRRAVLIGLLGFPIWALVGVGLGALVRRRWLAMSIAVLSYVATLFVAMFVAIGPDAAVVLAVVPWFTTAPVVDILFEPGVAAHLALLNPVCTALLATALLAAVRYRLVRSGPAARTGGAATPPR